MPRLLLTVCLLFAGVSLRAEDQPAPHSLAEAPGQMRVPPGFDVTLFAGEPDVVQPIAFAIDARGRLWVVECMSYPQWSSDGKGSDRIVILEDSDNDGRHDKKTVFYDQGVNLSGIELGFGGVYLTAVPNLIFIPDADGDDKPDGPPQILLDGWDLKAKHNVVNGLRWGPDGWLYGLNGILSNSTVGKPGSGPEERTAINCGVWRYHPTKQLFEKVADGTTNPWGLDFNETGQIFITNCVIKHLFHVIPGAHYTRMFGQDLNRYSYELIESCADHIHWGGGVWTDSRGGEGIHDGPGGGHAHVGAMIYQGGTWPERHHGNLFTCNVHGNRVNQDHLHQQGSGYVAHHDKDFLRTGDKWFRGLELKYGPDGNVFVTDWCDTGECHDYEEIQRGNGRIYKIIYGDAKAEPLQLLEEAGDAKLLEQLEAKNEWYARLSRRLLQERMAAGTLERATVPALRERLAKPQPLTPTLRTLWALHLTAGLTEAETLGLLDHKEAYVRGWAIQLDLEDRQTTPAVLAKLAKLATEDPSPVVRLYLAAALQRLPAGQGWDIAAGLVSHADDAKDQNLPLMYWYGIEPMVQSDRTKALALVARTKIPQVRQFIARRIAELAE